MAKSKRKNIKNNKKQSWYSPKKPNTWSTRIDIKPNKFKVIDGKERIYSCEVIINFFEKFTFDVRIFKFKQVPINRKIDIKFVENELNDFFGFIPSYNVGYFLRDKVEFAYLKSIEIKKEKYYKSKQKFDRNKKLNNILK